MQVAQSAESPEQIIAVNKALDSILNQHEGHERYNANCRLCIFAAARAYQQKGLSYRNARKFLSGIDVEIINDAIREVSTALDDYELVKPFPVSEVKQA